MKIRSIKVNYLLNALRVVCGALIGIITMPYVNKVLGAENIGKVEYVNTIINYFLLFSGLGIPMYGIREIAKTRDNIGIRNKVVLELLFILSITTIISYVLLFGVLYQLSFFHNYKDLLLIMSSMIILTNIGAEWYFQGMEDQLYITIRYVLVRFLALFFLFYLVRESSDYLYYAFILVLILGGSNVFNMIYLFKVIDICNIRFVDLDIKRHFKPIITVFVAAISVNIYLQLDIFLIGSLVGDKYVGYYSVSNKLVRFVIIFITVIGAVLLPRLTNLYQKDKIAYFLYLKKAFNFILLLSIPCSILLYAFSKNIIELMAGKEYVASVLTMKILSPLCIIVGIAYFLGYLFLYPQNKEKVYTLAVFYSALFSLLVNYFTIQFYFQNGAAVIAVLSELLAILIMFYLCKNDLKKLKLLDFNTFKIMFAALICFFLAIKLEDNLKNNDIVLFLFFSAISFLSFFVILKIIKEQTINELSQQLKKNLFGMLGKFTYGPSKT